MYACVVLVNNKNPLGSVRYAAVTDALLAGGVFLGETVLLPYDAPEAVSAALMRLKAACDGVFLVCDRVLLPAAREAVSAAAEKVFPEGHLLETEQCLFAVIPAGEQGGEIVRGEILPCVDKRRGQRFFRVVVRTVAAPPDKMRSAMQSATEAGEGRLFIHGGEEYGCGRIEIVYDAETPKILVDEAVRRVATELEEWVYALEDVPPEKQLFQALKLHRMHVATAESFTAGGVGQAIVSNAGASSVFYEGINAYDGGSKQERLGVNEFTLRSHGAVSDETAYEMAAGLIAQGHCDLSIATTGLAGPDADGTETPVGLCFIAIGTRERVKVYRYRLAGNRETVTKTAVNLALFLALKEIR